MWASKILIKVSALIRQLVVNAAMQSLRAVNRLESALSSRGEKT